MKAYQLNSINDLKYESIAIPDLQSGWCLVKVKAAGICSSDVPRIFNKGTYHFPTIPGHEFSGVVVKVADQEHESWIGKRVGVFPLIPCKECEPCLEHQYEMCKNYDYIGSRRDGAFAEYVLVPIWNLIELPKNISYEEAAMLEPLSVALHALKRAKLKKGNHVGIIGTGMIGFAAAQWAKSLGAAKVIVIGRNMIKKNLAKRIGVEYIELSDCSDELSFDVVIEAVGSNDSISQSISFTKSGGRIVLMGNPEGDINLSQDLYWKILRKQITVTGTWNSAYENSLPCDWTEAVSAISEKKINVLSLITHKFSQQQLSEGLELMRNHTEPYCKVMTIWNEV